MYLKYFGFQRAPFELVPDPDFLFLGEAHEAALANLVMGLQSGKGFVAISGSVGAGKTTVLRALLRRLKRPDQVCFLSQPETDVAGLLRAVLDGFGLDSGEDAVVELRRRVHDFLVHAEEPGILIVDEAHLLSEESLEQLRLLSNMEEDQRKLLQIVLSGQPELKQLLSRPRLRPLAQRIEMFYDIAPLPRDETARYIERRLAIAGAPDGVLFETGALDLIHHCSAGVPRLINLLADRSLVTGYVSDTGRITEALVREAYDDLGEVTQSVMPGSPDGGGRRRTPREVPPPAPHTDRANGTTKGTPRAS
ncbi:AAA family ATPase, partial [bacterium]|nr:AAA family ATPase [bacterium]